MVKMDLTARGGKGGNGGRRGDSCRAAWDTHDKTWIDDPEKNCWGNESVKSEDTREPGMDGKNGANVIGLIKPKFIPGINTSIVKEMFETWRTFDINVNCQFFLKE